MRIDRKMNIVIPVETEKGTLYVHSAPISRDVFVNNYLVIAKTFSSIAAEGLGAVAGPRVAAMLMKQVATDMGVWPKVEQGLIMEIVRLSNIAYPTETGYETTTLHGAVERGILDQRDMDEVINCLVFFTVASAMYRQMHQEVMLGGAAQLWGAEILSHDFTEFLKLLVISRPGANTGGTAGALSEIS